MNRTKMMISTLSAFGLLVGLVSAAIPARADVLTVFTPTGTISQMLSASESQEGTGGNIQFIGVAGLADPAAFHHPTTLCELGTSPCNSTTPFTSLSDIVGVIQATVFNQTFYFIGFTSDGENGLQPGIQAAYGGFGNSFIVEQKNTNQVINVTYLLSPALRSAGWTATFQSEFVVPESASLVLLGTGLLGVAGWARLRMRK